jgi:hypothetical protein
MTMEMSEFEVPQFYETAIAMRDAGEELDREFRFLCAPVAAIHPDNRYLLDDPPALLETLGLAAPKALRVAQLADAIFTLLRAEELLEAGPAEHVGSVLDLVSSPEWLAGQREADPAGALFAEYLAFAEVVPFEQSMLRGSALASLAMKSYGKGLAAAGVAGIPAVLTIHGAVVFLAAVGAAVTPAASVLAGAAGALVVVDSIGVAAGMVTSDRTAETILAVRRGIRRLIHRPADQPEPSPQESETPEQRREQEEEREQERKARVKRKQQRMKAKAPKLIIDPGPGALGDVQL